MLELLKKCAIGKSLMSFQCVEKEKNTHDRANLVGLPDKLHLNILQFVVNYTVKLR